METFFLPSFTVMIWLLQCGGPARPELAPHHLGLTTLFSRSVPEEVICSFARVVWALLAWLQEKSLAVKLDQALLVQSQVPGCAFSMYSQYKGANNGPLDHGV